MSVNHRFLTLRFLLLLELLTNLAVEVKQMKDKISYVQSLTSSKMVGYTMSLEHSLQPLHCKPFCLVLELFFCQDGDRMK